MADFSAEVEAAEVREADVQDKKIGRVFFEKGEGGAGGGEVGDVEVFGFEGVDEGIGDGRFVFDDEDCGHGGRLIIFVKNGKGEGRRWFF